MAIFHYTVKIVGRSKGKSIISASAYLNGDVMKNEETGRISYYTSKREVVYTSLLMCENAPQEWLNVPAENIRRFQKSVRYKRADNKEAALKKFKLTFQKQRLWNEVLRIEKSADAQLGRSFEFSLPKEWNRQEQIDYTTEYIQKTFVNKGMCADWSIHDKGDGNPHVHLLVTCFFLVFFSEREIKSVSYQVGGKFFFTSEAMDNPGLCGVIFLVQGKQLFSGFYGMYH